MIKMNIQLFNSCTILVRLHLELADSGDYVRHGPGELTRYSDFYLFVLDLDYKIGREFLSQSSRAK
jgi:hypothetical protein